MIQKAFGQTRLQYWLAKPLQRSLLQGPERGEEVAAVDRRNKARGQSLKRSRVVPIEQVTTMLFERRDGFERVQGSVDEFRHG
jgi:hypothetical protein